MAITLSGDNGITFPNSTIQASAGSVLQVVNATYSTGASTTSASFVDSGMSATITPKFSTSKIFALVNIARSDSAAADRDMYLTIYRNLTNIGGGSAVALAYSNVVSSRFLLPISMSVLDSPATTSATTYKVYFLTTSGASVSINSSTVNSTITLMEIAA